eukprot:CAMPEP_0203743220 /NCGR_PEP_ID=MMETSP0092-20131115/59320_1 /ASSEMBLY_ACC=CAM_ASM_001090 /TAXON_ID=426623 /ORGANISM="Chaetoceros affinis, Strain CCMP159" /LENGTH=126 /DNA_ID=CAMNT_0050630511 /DNA_START=176 /DNA_END=557 /DNA_ORIENTATION=+
MMAKAVPKKAAPASKSKPVKKVNFIYEDGLTEIERKQRITQPNFLTGSAKSQIDESSIRPELVEEDQPTPSPKQQLLLSFLLPRSSIRPELLEVGSTYSFSQSTTLALVSVATVVILAIIKGGGGF